MPQPTPLAYGKVPQELLARLLRDRTAAPEEVVGPGVGLDAAVLEVGDVGGFLVAASDPITFTAGEIGWYAVHVNANDVACMGARPAWFVATLLLPRGTVEDEIAEILRQIDEACAGIGAALVGGHTEITSGIDRPLVAGTMLGLTERWLSAGEAEPGDALLLTKGVAVEGTAILARDLAERLEGRIEPEVLERARGFLRDPGLSVVPDAAVALRAGRVHALHDPTEGGVATGIRELCEASGTGARIEVDAIPVFEETRAIAEALDLDPLGLIASGALLVATAEGDAERIAEALEEEGIPAARIGTVSEGGEGITAVGTSGKTAPLKRFEADELTRVL
ncbi:MAG: hydrogenase expression protein [Gemmatimonadetes bacterium]|nr:hydrogenase expression protein [Gemmatimonadota bacterium]NIR77223.1 hydrogenase expression protein [Gemmatimonadota bacterium]NIT85740.1 hydrogenase expression protein [Gemmatimonadota bacterium]NIU29567.1 hydrogenase expression protein [Gemmatimonadota bacterium]NIU34616.1 hydrogenase expression protein [Gemmatimonadota bacterium]